MNIRTPFSLPAFAATFRETVQDHTLFRVDGLVPVLIEQGG